MHAKHPWPGILFWKTSLQGKHHMASCENLLQMHAKHPWPRILFWETSLQAKHHMAGNSIVEFHAVCVRCPT
jgi:hypothetical protein